MRHCRDFLGYIPAHVTVVNVCIPPNVAVALQVTRARIGKASMQEYTREAQGLPVLIITGAKDRCAMLTC